MSRRARKKPQKPENRYGIKVFLYFVECSLLVNLLQNVYNHHDDVLAILKKEIDKEVIDRVVIFGHGKKRKTIIYKINRAALSAIETPTRTDKTVSLIAAIYRYVDQKKFFPLDDDLLQEKWTKEFIKKWAKFFEKNLEKNIRGRLQSMPEYTQALEGIKS
jgi:hypothetical protein